jgi:DNA-binding CsgD family transcriptional regulator
MEAVMPKGVIFAEHTQSEVVRERRPDGSCTASRFEGARGIAREVVAAIASGLTGGALTAPDSGGAESEVLVVFELAGFRYALTRRQLMAEVHLSPREEEIVRLVANGLPNKCIGAVLDISAWTVATHLRRIFAKLGVTSRSAMIARVVGQIGPGISCSHSSEAIVPLTVPLGLSQTLA